MSGTDLNPELLHDDVDQLHLQLPRFVHGAQVAGGHAVGHQKLSEDARLNDGSYV